MEVNTPCPGCGKVGRIAQRVKKTGPTKDRIFATCPGCSRIDWVGGADAAEPPAVPRKPRA